jgi:hypothetical protein
MVKDNYSPEDLQIKRITQIKSLKQAHESKSYEIQFA